MSSYMFLCRTLLNSTPHSDRQGRKTMTTKLYSGLVCLTVVCKFSARRKNEIRVLELSNGGAKGGGGYPLLIVISVFFRARLWRATQATKLYGLPRKMKH